MSVQSGFSRWQKVRRATGRIPLRIKLISAVLALVLIALGAISFGGITLLRNYLLAPYNAGLLASQHDAQHTTERCLPPGPSPCPLLVPGNTMADWLTAGGRVQQVVVAVEPQFAVMPSQSDIIPGPVIPAEPGWAAGLAGHTATLPAESGGGHWRVTAFPTRFINGATGQTTTGTIIVGIDVSSVYRTLDGLALIDLIVSGSCWSRWPSSGSRSSAPACAR